MLQGRLHILVSKVWSRRQPWATKAGEEHSATRTHIVSISHVESKENTKQRIKTLQKELQNDTFSTLLLMSAFPFSISAISSLIERRASQNLSSSAYNTRIGSLEFFMGHVIEKSMLMWWKRFVVTLLSLSVGSIMSVPGTGHDMVGAWNP